MSKKKQKKKEPPRHESTIDEVVRAMRKEALKQNAKPSFRFYKGWHFGLSFGLSPDIPREAWDTYKDSLLARLQITDEKLLSATYEDFIAAREATKGLKLPKEWIFSACLHPRGRSSTQEDWDVLGRMLAVVGAPIDSLRTPFETTHPNDVHYWTWIVRETDPS